MILQSPETVRHNALLLARDILQVQWEKECEFELITAEVEDRAPNLPPPPSLEDVTNLAEALFAFVVKS